MTISTLVKGFAGALSGRNRGGGRPSGRNDAHAHQSTHSKRHARDIGHFTATATESLVIDEGYQVNDLETLTNNMVTLSGGGPNLLGSTWQSRFAAVGSISYTFNDGTPVPALGFAAQDPPNLDTFYQIFATVPGDTYTYSFNYSNNTAGFGATPSQLVVTASSVPEPSTWAMLLLGFAGVGFATYRASAAADLDRVRPRERRQKKPGSVPP